MIFCELPVANIYNTPMFLSPSVQREAVKGLATRDHWINIKVTTSLFLEVFSLVM